MPLSNVRKVPGERVGEWVIERRHGQRANLLGRMPADLLRIARMRFALPLSASVKKQYKRTTWHPAAFFRTRGEAAGESHRHQPSRIQHHAKFLVQFANPCTLGSFAGLNLTPGKLP